MFFLTFFLSCNGELLPILVLVDRLLKKIFNFLSAGWLPGQPNRSECTIDYCISTGDFR